MSLALIPYKSLRAKLNPKTNSRIEGYLSLIYLTQVHYLLLPAIQVGKGKLVFFIIICAGCVIHGKATA